MIPNGGFKASIRYDIPVFTAYNSAWFFALTASLGPRYISGEGSTV
jgi:hypothetical protein